MHGYAHSFDIISRRTLGCLYADGYVDRKGISCRRCLAVSCFAVLLLCWGPADPFLEFEGWVVLLQLHQSILQHIICMFTKQHRRNPSSTAERPTHVHRTHVHWTHLDSMDSNQASLTYVQLMRH